MSGALGDREAGSPAGSTRWLPSELSRFLSQPSFRSFRVSGWACEQAAPDAAPPAEGGGPLTPLASNLWEANEPHRTGGGKKLPRLVPGHAIVHARPDRLLTGHLGTSCLERKRHFAFMLTGLVAPASAAALSGFPLGFTNVCMWPSARSPANFLRIQSLLPWELVLQINVFVQPYTAGQPQ